MNQVIVRLLEAGDIRTVARIHFESLPEDFLPSLGLHFLDAVYYPAAIRSQHAVTFIARLDGQRVGFVTVAHNSDRYTNDILKGRYSTLASYALGASLRDPMMLIRSFQVVRSALLSKPDPVKSEIVFIAVDEPFRGRGVGSLLISRAIKYLQNKGQHECRTKTLASNMDVIRVYQKLGWKERNRFRLMDRDYVTLVLDVRKGINKS